MNEWEWQLLEDKTPRGSASKIAGVEVRAGRSRAAASAPGGDIFDIALAGSRRPSKRSSRTTKARSTSASCSTTIPAATWA